MGNRMSKKAEPEIEDKIRLWMKKNKRENSRLEFKLKVDLSTIGAKAKFIGDVIALANSEGEYPRSDGYLIIGFRNGECFDIQSEHYEGAKFGQLLDSYISPHVNVFYEEFKNGKRRHVGVLVVKADVHVLYIVAKELRDEKGKPELLPGQSWGRKSDRKVALQGEQSSVDSSTSPREKLTLQYLHWKKRSLRYSEKQGLFSKLRKSAMKWRERENGPR
jgi:hypothetical protein